MDNTFINRLKCDLRESLPENRFEHTIGVAYTASALAMRYGYDIEEALIAGLLHDAAKYYSDEQMITVCREHGVEIREVELRNVFLLHGKAAAIIAQEKYGIEKQCMLDALRYHTTGRPDMSLLEKIIFVADFIEPGRKQFNGMETARKLAFENIDQAVLKILSLTISYVKENPYQEMDEMTVKTYDYYKRFERSQT